MEDGVEAIKDLVKNSEDMSADRETEEQIQQGSDRAEEGKSSGVVKNLISALVSRGREGEEDVEGEGKSEDGRASNPVDEASGGGGGGGGIINSLISNIFHQSEAGDGENKSNGDGERAKNGGENEQVKAAEEGGGGGGGSILDNIVSHLPKPISDGMAPATEEASMLIHSIVRD